MSDRYSLRRKIAEEEARLARIEKKRAETLAILEDLKSQLAASVRTRASRKPTPSDRSPFPSRAPSARAACGSGVSRSPGWSTFSESIRAAGEIPFEVDIVEKDLRPPGAKGRRKT